jgi:hypothetical protein
MGRKTHQAFPAGVGREDATLPGHTSPANSGCQLTERKEGQLHDGKACRKLNDDLLELARVAKSRTELNRDFLRTTRPKEWGVRQLGQIFPPARSALCLRRPLLILFSCL